MVYAMYITHPMASKGSLFLPLLVSFSLLWIPAAVRLFGFAGFAAVTYAGQRTVDTLVTVGSCRRKTTREGRYVHC